MEDLKEGSYVVYRNEAYWIYEVKETSYVIIPEDSLDFEEGTIHLNKAIVVNKDRVRAHGKNN